MAYKDIRHYMQELERVFGLVRVKEEVDWDLELPAIVRRNSEVGGPGILFENIRDYPGYRTIGCYADTWGKTALLMEIDPQTPPPEIMAEWERKMAKRLKPVEVKEGPCQEVVMTGKDVDLSKLPIPMPHDGDGGRYNTLYTVVTKDPDTGWVNWGVYRTMVYNEKFLTGLLMPTQDIGRHWAKYKGQGKPMPFAMFFGGDLLYGVISAAPVGVGVDEVDVVGGIRGEPVKLVKCKTVDLMVPADAEIVFEGHVLPDIQLEEGPYGEYTGYRSVPREPRPVYQVECITQRKDPIYVTQNNCPPSPCDIYLFWIINMTNAASKLLHSLQLPVTGVYVPPEGVGHVIVVSVKKTYEHIAEQIGHILAGNPSTIIAMDKLLVVEDDVDIYNWNEVIHAMASKLHPINNVITFRSRGSPLASFLNLRDRTLGHGGRLVLDCTWPLEWAPETEKPPRLSWNEMYPKEIQKKIADKWSAYGFKS